MNPAMTPEEYEAQRQNDEESRRSNGVVPFPTARPLPSNAAAEKGLVACCLIEEEQGAILRRARDSGITPEHFSDPRLSTCYRRLCAMQDDEIPVEIAMLATELEGNQELEAAGGMNFLIEATADNPTSIQAAYFIEKVRETALLRAIIRAGTSTVEDAFNFSGDIDTFAAEIQRRTTAVTDLRRAKGTAYTVWNPADFRAYVPPPNLNLIGAGYLRRRQLTTLIGPPGVGKSRLSLWLGCSHIAGRSFMGLDSANHPAKWLFFGNENDPLRQKTDLEWFYRNLTAVEQALVDANLFLHVLEKPDDGIITLSDPEAYQKLTSTLKAVVPDVIVFDPWGNMIEGNENDNEEIRRTLKALFRAVTTCCPEAAMLVIHHARTGKSTALEAGNNYSGGSLGRGSKALVSAARCELALWPGHSEDSSKLVLTCEKVNNVKKFEPKGLVFENGVYHEDASFSVEAWRDDIEGARGGKTLTIQDLVNTVKAGFFKASEIVKFCADEFDASKATVNRRLAEAVDKGWLAKTQPAGSYTLGDKAIKKP